MSTPGRISAAFTPASPGLNPRRPIVQVGSLQARPMRPPSPPPATPTDYFARGARNVATVDAASPAPGLLASLDTRRRAAPARSSASPRPQAATLAACAVAVAALGAAAAWLLHRR